MKQQSGFTLIELVMVIVILGILAAVAVPRYFDMSTQAQDAAEAGARNSVATAVAIAAARNRRAPSGTEVAGEMAGTSCGGAGVITVPGTSPSYVTVALITTAGAAPASCATTDIGGVGAANYVP